MFGMVTESLFAVRPRNIRFDIGVAVVGLVSIRVIIWLSLWKTPLPDNLQPLSTATLPLLVRKKNIITALSLKNYQRFAHRHMKVYSEKRNALLGHPTPRVITLILIACASYAWPRVEKDEHAPLKYSRDLIMSIPVIQTGIAMAHQIVLRSQGGRRNRGVGDRGQKLSHLHNNQPWLRRYS